jgi:hypothetical protein
VVSSSEGAWVWLLYTEGNVGLVLLGPTVGATV